MTEPLYDFRSDNVDGAAPEILEALVEANSGTAAPYGDDEYTRRMNERFAALFAGCDLYRRLIGNVIILRRAIGRFVVCGHKKTALRRPLI